MPDITHNKIYKEVQLKSKTIEKELTKKEFQDYAPKIHPSILLKLAYEIFKNDDAEVIDLLVIN